jgi:microcystin-dependent protein
MATITGLTAQRMLEIEAASVVDGEVVSGNLVLTTHGGTNINAGSVIGPVGPTGPVGPVSSIPGEIKLWPGGTLPDPAQYGKWVWADGAVYVVATYPKAAGNIGSQWRTFAGASDPGAANFRVPDLRGLVPAGLDAMPGGSRANRMTRAVAITIAARTGEETHIVAVGEMPAHNHALNWNDPGHYHAINDPGHYHYIDAFSHSYVQQVSVAPGIDVGVTQAMTNDFAGTPNNGNVGVAKSVGTGIGIYSSGTGIGASIAANGGGGGHENVQPTVFVPYIVCLSG